MPSISKDLAAASTTPIVLSILEAGDSYGYAIIQEVKALSNGEMAWAEGMLYPILHRLEKRGYVNSFWGKAETGRKRKYYAITATGRQALVEQQQQWRQIYEMMTRLSQNKAEHEETEDV